MRVMVLAKASPESETGRMRSTERLGAMTAFNEALAKAGVLVSGEWLHPSSRGHRVRFAGEDRTVVDGPFAETKEIVAGFWLWRVGPTEEALDWARRSPMREGELELRLVFEAEDFGEAFTPDQRARGRPSRAAGRRGVADPRPAGEVMRGPRRAG